MDACWFSHRPQVDARRHLLIWAPTSSRCLSIFVDLLHQARRNQPNPTRPYPIRPNPTHLLRDSHRPQLNVHRFSLVFAPISTRCSSMLFQFCTAPLDLRRSRMRTRTRTRARMMEMAIDTFFCTRSLDRLDFTWSMLSLAFASRVMVLPVNVLTKICMASTS